MFVLGLLYTFVTVVTLTVVLVTLTLVK